MRIRWTPAAAADLQQISDYLKRHYPRYRQPTMRKLYSAIESLKGWAYRTRELLLHPLPYIALYRVNEQTLEVLRIYHGAQDRSSM